MNIIARLEIPQSIALTITPRGHPVEPLSSSNSFFILFTHSAFLVFSFSSLILLQNCFVSFGSSCLFVLVYSLLGLLAGPSGIRVGWGIETNGRFEAEKPPTSIGPPSGGLAAFLSPMHPLYSTRPHGLVQAIFWHTCPDLDLGPWYCLTH